MKEGDVFGGVGGSTGTGRNECGRHIINQGQVKTDMFCDSLKASDSEWVGVDKRMTKDRPETQMVINKEQIRCVGI